MKKVSVLLSLVLFFAAVQPVRAENAGEPNLTNVVIACVIGGAIGTVYTQKNWTKGFSYGCAVLGGIVAISTLSAANAQEISEEDLNAIMDSGQVVDAQGNLLN